MDRLAVFKVLGDNTRYAIYLELARSVSPKSTAEIAEVLELHANTIRPHLERMRDIGLLQVWVDAKGTVGRPQHRYSLSPDAPSLGLEPSAWPVLARMLADVAAFMAPEVDDVAALGEEQGRAAADRRRGRPCVSALVDTLAELGFDPASAEEGKVATIAFTHCPFRELAEQYPDLVCNLHRGLIEGFVDELGGADVIAFATLADRDPCHVEVLLK
ncbi:MAG: helix-turn-helix domain-containing protein [Actinomycetota bacterium]|nr:helix-turn-helix domain-containing protein [Actinomycetota bacterium]